MASSSPMKSDGKVPRINPKEGQAASPECSLTWCLAHLCTPGAPGGAEQQGDPGRDTDKRAKMCQWRALVAIRTQHIKGGKAGIATFRGKGGLRLLLNLLQHPDCSKKTLDLALSILANCCTELDTRLEVRMLEGINIVVDIMKRNVALETVQNRAARALGNLAMDPESSALIHSAGGVPLLLLCVSLSSVPSSPTAAPPSDSCPKLECAQSAARALLYLSDSPSNRLSLLSQGALPALAPLIAPEYPSGLRRAALRTLHELTRGCGVECAREVSRSGVLTQLGVMASGEAGPHFEELALKTLANLCSQGCLRPLVGSLGVIRKFTEEVKRDPLKSGVFLKALCLCCKEAVNRARVKEVGGLEALTNFLSSHQNHPLSRFAILACVDFVFDESAMEQLQELGLVPVLVARLVRLARGEEPPTERADVSVPSNASPAELLSSSGLESFDFPPADGLRKEDVGREHGSSSFLSLRSWLLSEGLISSEGELLDSSCADAGCGCPNPSSSSSQTSSPNPDSSPSPRTPSSSSSASKKAALSPSSSSSSSCWSVADPFSSCGTSPPTLAASSPVCQPLVSPSKSSSSQKRRRCPSAASLAQVTLDSPPSVPRASAYSHPYHPEPWTAESPVLLLLSRFSHASDPSAALVSPGVVSGLLCYLTRHPDPSSRCFRMLGRLSCNPSCLQALVRTGSVALVRHHLCSSRGGPERRERQTARVKAKVKQLGDALLNNLRVQCESGFGSGVLAHVMLTGSESDKMNCALSLPFISSSRSLLRKLLLDCGGLLAALKPLDREFEDDEDEDDRRTLPSELPGAPRSEVTSPPCALYFSLLIGCLSALTAAAKTQLVTKPPAPPGDADRVSPPPPLKKPRLADSCPYAGSDFDLILQLDDGSRVPANREGVAGAEGSDRAGSEYFRALLRGGFGEARGGAGEAIRLRDVSAGMLLPLLHHLHGCRFRPGNAPGTGAQCQTLDSLVLDGLAVLQSGTEELSAEGFQKTPLGEAMVGACRFLVGDLQRELEDVLVSFLLSCSGSAVKKPDAVKTDRVQKRSHPAEDDLELELAAQAQKLDRLLQEVEDGETSFSGTIHKVIAGLNESTIRKVISGSRSVCGTEEQPLGPTDPPKDAERPTEPAKDAERPTEPAKDAERPTAPLKDAERPTEPAKDTERPTAPLKDAERPTAPLKDAERPTEPAKDAERPTEPPVAAERGALAAWLPRLYWFSQRYSYPALGRACLALLLGFQDRPGPFSSSSVAAGCLRRLAREADCTEALKRDLLSLVSEALG